MKPIPLFDFNETRQVARAVGFNPLAGLGRECLDDARNIARYCPAGVSAALKFQAQYYVAVGLYLYATYGVKNLSVPDNVLEWYELNTARTHFETFFYNPKWSGNVNNDVIFNCDECGSPLREQFAKCEECDAPKTPDWLPGMEQARIDALEHRIGTLEAWADIDFTAAANNGTPDCVHDLIVEGMNGVTSHCQESAAALVTVLGTATDKRIDAVLKQVDLLQSLVLNVKALLLNVDARLDALETKTPC